MRPYADGRVPYQIIEARPIPQHWSGDRSCRSCRTCRESPELVFYVRLRMRRDGHDDGFVQTDFICEACLAALRMELLL